MNYIPRTVYKHLLDWKRSPRRKVLLLRGARQVGKTYIIRKLGAEFESFVEINLLEQPAVRSLFSGPSLDPNKIVEALSAYVGVPIHDNKTLLFFDEIQACPEAIATLRFFFEKRPGLHVVATGSLLEFALEDLSSFGVGRIEYLYLYPVSFKEFLEAHNELALLNQIEHASPTAPLPDLLHLKALALLKNYLQIGGLPEAQTAYLENKDLVLTARLYANLLTAYEDDFAKYRKRLSVDSLTETFRSTAIQAGKKFVYSHSYRDANTKTVSKALELLVRAGIVHKVYHTAANGVPLGGEINLSKFKTVPFDIGIFNRLNGLPLSEIATLDPLALINKGALVEVYCGLELLCNKPPLTQENLFYWHREAKSSNAEVDYLAQVGNQIIPLEVKSSKKGSMHSLHLFLKEKHGALGVRLSTENFSRYGSILVLPLYAVSELDRLVTLGL